MMPKTPIVDVGLACRVSVEAVNGLEAIACAPRVEA
jgi:hypothetical protein